MPLTAATEIPPFLRFYYEYQFVKGSHLEWRILGLRALSGEHDDYSGTNAVRSDADLIKMFETYVRESWETHLWDWENSRDWFLQTYPNTPATGPVEHPWGDERVNICRCWLTAPLPVVFDLYVVAHAAATDLVTDNLLTLATGEEYSMADFVEKAVARHMQRVYAELKAYLIANPPNLEAK